MIHYPVFDPFPELRAFTTTKNEFAPENPKFTGEDAESCRLYREKLAEMLEMDDHRMVFAGQTHSDNVAIVQGVRDNDPGNTDALITGLPGVCLCIQTADCVPVLLYDPEKKVIAAIHAGWRGTFSQITAKVIRKMNSYFSCDPADIYAAIGPSIGPENYETGDDVAALFKERFTNWDSFIVKHKSKMHHIDLWKANRLQLLESGAAIDKITVLGHCTYSMAEIYYSARREGISTGRMVSGIMLRG